MDPLLILGIVLTVSFMFSEVFRELKYPVAVAQILAGIFLGIPILKSFLFDKQSLTMIQLLAQLGILFLLFMAGLEIDIRKILKSAKDSVMIAFSSAFLTFIFGFIFLKLLGYGSITAILFGIAISVTAEGTTTKVLMEFKALNTYLGAIFIGAGTVDDIIEVLGLAIVLILGHSGGIKELVLFPFQLIVFAILIVFFFKVLSKVIDFVERTTNDVDFYLIVLINVFFIAAFSTVLEIGYLIGAIFAGFIIQVSIMGIHRKTKAEKRTEKDVMESIKLMTLAFLIPFFFIEIGLEFDYKSILAGGPLLLLGAVAIAIAGKIVGTMAIKPFSKLKLDQLYLIGWAMNSRGGVDLIIAITALKFGLITSELFSVLVATSITTTLIFPFALKHGIEKHKGIMNYSSR